VVDSLPCDQVALADSPLHMLAYVAASCRSSPPSPMLLRASAHKQIAAVPALRHMSRESDSRRTVRHSHHDMLRAAAIHHEAATRGF